MKFNIIHIIICIFVFVGCTQQTVNNSVECFTIKESGSSLVYCSDTLKIKNPDGNNKRTLYCRN